jgi:hypothetical protein
VNFCVWDMPGMNMILGVPVTLDYFLVALVNVLEIARQDGQSNTEADTVHHWSLTDTNGVQCDFPDVTSLWTQL